MGEVVKNKKNELPTTLQRNFVKKQLYFKRNNGRLQETKEYVVVDEVDNSVVRPCKSSYEITHNNQILDGVKESAFSLGYNVVGVAPFKTNEGMFVIVDANINIPAILSHLINEVNVFIIEGNSEDVSLSSGIIIKLINGAEVIYHNTEMKSGTRSSKAFSKRKYVIPSILTKAVDISSIILANLEKLIYKTAPLDFVDDNYRKDKDGSTIKGENGKFESNIIDIKDFMELFISSYSDKSFAGYIIAYMSAISTRFIDQTNPDERYTQMFATQSSVNKKVIPIFEKYLYKK